MDKDRRTKRRPTYAIQRRSLWRSRKRRCHYCDVMLTLARDGPNSMTLDHRIPLSRGGLNKPFNYVPACARCNNAKGSMTEAEYRLLMARQAAERRCVAA